MRYRRVYQPGARYFFTVVTENRCPLLIEHIDRLRESFRLCVNRHPFEIEAIVVLPDHVHTLWRLPDGDINFSMRWMVIKRHFSTGLPRGVIGSSKAKKREKGIWQRRFWEHMIRDEEDWRRHVDYIHYNPVKHGYASKPEDWEYGSYQQAVRKGWYEAGVAIDVETLVLDFE
ncbi:REP-associated tyrosine transposase [Desulfoluna butyratoxydans]|uniref:Transposase is200-like n=1 Tax=Desulfoluna butyratoxydans TaxID=231438 RepID=A0A4U8YTM9_9BACT|nr:transposase [Desulfoluna butyratoxydans]VFQ46729.1 transposase is200-like [Desulfoluna butyratoxydans]